MKKLILSSFIVLLFCSPFISLSITNKSYKAILSKKEDPFKSKTFSKSSPVLQNDKIDLYNKYGSLTIKVWDKKEIKLDAELKAYGLTENEAQGLLDSIYIDVSKAAELISFKTTVISKNKSWGQGTINGLKFHKEIKVNMTVYMPASNALTATTSYGNLVMDDFNAPASIKVLHGNFTGSNLNSTENTISVQYGKIELKDVNSATIDHLHGDNLVINNINSLNLDAKYSTVNIGIIKNKAVIKQLHGNGLTIKEAGSLDLNAKYATVNIGTINNAIIKQHHGDKLAINSIKDLNLTAQYVDVDLAKLNGNSTTNLLHGSLKINEVTNRCKNLKIDVDYADIKLGFNNNYNADFNLTTSYGDFISGANITAQNLTKEKNNNAKKYTGKIGKGDSSFIINIDARHSDINFN